MKRTSKRKVLIPLAASLFLTSLVGVIGHFEETKIVMADGIEVVDSVVNLSGDASLWENVENATFKDGNMEANAGNFTWKTKQISGDCMVDFSTTESLDMQAMADWKWEYLSFNTSGEDGIEPSGGVPTIKNSVNLVWGWTSGFAIIEKDADGNVVFQKKLGLGENDIRPDDLVEDADTANIMNQFHYYNFNKEFRIKTQVTELSNGVRFDFELITQSPWGHPIDYKFHHTTTNQALKGARFVGYGRTGSGTVDGTHKIVSSMKVAPLPMFSSNPENFIDTTGAAFDGDIMSATTSSFNWKSKKVAANAFVDFSTTESLEMNPVGDWKWEYLSFNTSGDVGIDAGGGLPTIKNSVNLVWGWTSGFAIIEKDADGNVVFQKKLGLGENDIRPDDLVEDADTANIMNQFHFYNFNKEFRIKTNVTELEDGVQFDFELITQSPWGHPIDYKFHHISHNESLMGEKHIVYGRTGSGTVDDTHKILVKMNVKAAMAAAEIEEPDQPDPIVPVDDDMTHLEENAENFGKLSNAALDADGLYFTGTPAMVVSQEFGGDAKVKFVLDNKKFNAGWGGFVFMLKGTYEDISASTWAFDLSKNANYVTQAKGNWLAFSITHGGYQFIECVNGKVNIIGDDLHQSLPGVNGYSFWYCGQQRNELIVETKDTATGVNFKVSFTPSGHASNTGETFSTEFSSTNRALWGKQAAAIGYILGQTTPEKGNNNIELHVTAKNSEYSYDLYKALEFGEFMDSINYESITLDNYSELLTKADGAKALHDALSADQLALVKKATLDKLTKLQNDLANVDAAVFAKLAIEKLPTEAFTRANYEENSTLIKDAITKYNALSDDQKATFSDDEKQQLKTAQAALVEFDDLLAHADPVVELIAKITLPITNYGKDMRVIKEAAAAYDELYDDEKALVDNKELLENARAELAAYQDANRPDGYNFADNVDNFAEMDGYEGFVTTQSGLRVNVSGNQIGVYPTISVEDGKEVTFLLDSELDKCTWGNYYFIFKSDSLIKHHSAGAWVQEGNYGVLLIGGDGFKIVECVNGVLPMTKDAAGNPIADFQTVLQVPQVEEGGTGADIYYVYKQYTKLTIKTINLKDESGNVIGYKAIFTLTGGDSGATITREYVSNNALAANAGYYGLELYVSNPINNGNGGGLTIEGIYVEDVDAYDGAAAKEAMQSQIRIDLAQSLLDVLPADVDETNYDVVAGQLAAAKDAVNKLSADEKAKLTGADKLELLEAKVTSISHIAQAREAINALILDVNENNLAEAERLLANANRALDSLTEKEAAELANIVSRIDNSAKAIEDYKKAHEEPIDEPSSDPTSEPSEQPSETQSPSNQEQTSQQEGGKKKGCKGEASGAGLGLFALIGALIIRRKKNK